MKNLGERILASVGLRKAEPTEMPNPPSGEGPDFSTGTVVFALLCNKSVPGIYTSDARAEAARGAFARSYPDSYPDRLYEIKPFKLDGPAMLPL